MAICHANHEWQNGIPESIGDRYYGQDLNDDFNYLKHIPYEMFLRGKKSGVIIPPTDALNDTSLTLTGGLGAIEIATQAVNENSQWTLPPSAVSTTRHERVAFNTVSLTLPQDNTLHKIVATPQKVASASRVKVATQSSYNSRSNWVANISIDDTYDISSHSKILIGFCWNNEYILLIDGQPTSKDVINVVSKWNLPKHYTEFLPMLQQYSGQSDAKYIKAHITYEGGSGAITHISGGYYKDCVIEIPHIYRAIDGGVFENCDIMLGNTETSRLYHAITNGTFENCKITVASSTSNTYQAIFKATLNRCTINFALGDPFDVRDILNDCVINMSGTAKIGLGGGGHFTNCVINIANSSTDHTPIDGGGALFCMGCTINDMVGCELLVSDGSGPAEPMFANCNFYCSNNNTHVERGKYYMCYIYNGKSPFGISASNGKGVIQGDTIIAPFS